MALFESASLVVTPNGTKASKLYSVKPANGSGDMTVTRATTATRVNASGLIESVSTNVPRLDYTNSTCPSILIEPQRTNLLLRSEEFDNITWTKTAATVTANSVISPDGTQDADTLNGDTVNSFHQAVQIVSVVNATSYTFSVFAKKGTNNFVQLTPSSAIAGVNAWGNFDLLNGTVGTIGSATTASIVNYGNGWYRCSITFTATATVSATVAFIIVQSATSPRGETGSNNKNINLWGAQLEAGSSATSYIPTTTASVTRNADVISKTGISSLIGQTEGTLYTEVNIKNWESGSKIFSISDGTTSNRINILTNTSNRLRGLITTSGALEFDISSSTLTNGTYKIALAYKQNDVVLYINGSQIGTDSSVNVPACSNAYLGKVETVSTASILNDSIKSAALWKTRLTNAELAALTTL